MGNHEYWDNEEYREEMAKKNLEWWRSRFEPLFKRLQAVKVANLTVAQMDEALGLLKKSDGGTGFHFYENSVDEDLRTLKELVPDMIKFLSEVPK